MLSGRLFSDRLLIGGLVGLWGKNVDFNFYAIGVAQEHLSQLGCLNDVLTSGYTVGIQSCADRGIVYSGESDVIQWTCAGCRRRHADSE